MSVIINKEVYPTLELAMAQFFGKPYEVAFAFYDVVDMQKIQKFDNAFNVTISIIVKGQEDE